MSDTLFEKNSTKILATWLNDVNTNTYSAANKAALVLLTPALGLTVFVESSDGGLFKAVVGAAALTYADNGGAYCGTITIPTGGDGSIAWVRDYDGAIYDKWFGAAKDIITTDDTVAIQAAFATNAATIVIGSNRITGQITINDGQSLIIDGDLFIDWSPTLGVSATFETAMDATVFVNKTGFDTAKAFITGLSAPKAFITAVNNSGNFLPNENHTATANGDTGISIVQRSGGIYSSRARYSDSVGPYAVVGLFIVENCDVTLNNVDNMGAGVWGYHVISSKINVQSRDIGTDLSQSTTFLGGSFGGLFVGKALCWNNDINLNGLDSNDVLIMDGICRGNQGSVVSNVDSTDASAENHRVYELSDNCRGNIFNVTANDGGDYEHVVFQDGCSANITKLTSETSQGRGINLRRDCNNNKFNLTIREWDKANLGLGAIELFQSGTDEGCKNNDFDIIYEHATSSKKVIRELLSDASKPHLDNTYIVDKGEGSASGLADFVDTNGNFQAGALVVPKIGASFSVYGESSLMTTASTTITINQQGLTSIAAIRMPYDSQIRGFKCISSGTITAGQIDVTIEVFRGASWVILGTLVLNNSIDSVPKKYRDMVDFFIDTPVESLRVRAASDVSFVGSTNVIFYLDASESVAL